MGTACVTDTKKGLCNSSIYFICQKFLVLLLGVKLLLTGPEQRGEVL